MPKFCTPAELAAAKGRELGPTGWFTVTQERIDQFAQSTQDFQWLHVDPVRAAAGPFGTTIAHGFLTLSLLPMFIHQYDAFDDRAMVVNYGLDRVRFVSPVPVASRLRARSVIVDVVDVTQGVQLNLRTTVDVAGSSRPACVADTLSRVQFALEH